MTEQNMGYPTFQKRPGGQLETNSRRLFLRLLHPLM